MKFFNNNNDHKLPIYVSLFIVVIYICSFEFLGNILYIFIGYSTSFYNGNEKFHCYGNEKPFITVTMEFVISQD